MDRQHTGNGRHPQTSRNEREEQTFVGFLPLTGNFLYCPNQFFDLCLAHHSRGVVRLVGYLLRRTLGWLDEHGNPIEQRIEVSYQELVDRAQISRGAIRDVLSEAVKGRLVRYARHGRANENGRMGEASRFELCWDPDGEYTSEPKNFRGFFTGEGHRSPIPNDFFDRVLPNEPLAVVQVVGAVLRHTVGYQNQFGGRRQQAPLSYSYLQRYTGIGGRRHLAAAIERALEANFIHLVKEGTFDPNAADGSEAAEYAVKWAASEPFGRSNGSKREPGPNGPSRAGTVQKGNRVDSSKREPDAAFKKGTGNGPLREPEERFKKGTVEKTLLNNTSKEQQQEAVAEETILKLVEEGFDQSTAKLLTAKATLETIQNQVRWIDQRAPNRNRLGMLRNAILEDWPEPSAELRTSEVLQKPVGRFAECFYAGLAGNAGAPVAQPSANDLAAAERLLSRLQELAPQNPEVERWGRSFGAFTRQARDGQKNPLNSLVVAVRSYGDKFYAEEAKRLERRKVVAAQEEAQRQKAALEPEYRRYLEQFEERVRRDRPEEHKAFLGWRAGERERYAKSRFGARDMSDWFDSLQKRLDDVRLYFEQETQTFDAWLKARRGSGKEACESSPSSMPREAAARAPSP